MPKIEKREREHPRDKYGRRQSAPGPCTHRGALPGGVKYIHFPHAGTALNPAFLHVTALPPKLAGLPCPGQPLGLAWCWLADGASSWSTLGDPYREGGHKDGAQVAAPSAPSCTSPWKRHLDTLSPSPSPSSTPPSSPLPGIPKPAEGPSFISAALPPPPPSPPAPFSNIPPFFSFPTSSQRSKAPFCPQAIARSKDKCEWAGTGHMMGYLSHPTKFHSVLNPCTMLFSGLMVELRGWFATSPLPRQHLSSPTHPPTHPMAQAQRRWADGRHRPLRLADAATAPAWARLHWLRLPRKAPGRLSTALAASCSLN